ncbi:MAG: hypothetical protein IPH20_17700 [Bacteroidales bacterium]|nr:hypothetical protein [Bacteroidales bacterium]
MKSPKNNKSDQVEKELQDMIDQLNSENVALTKILSLLEPKEKLKDRKKPGSGEDGISEN